MHTQKGIMVVSAIPAARIYERLHPDGIGPLSIVRQLAVHYTRPLSITQFVPLEVWLSIRSRCRSGLAVDQVSLSIRSRCRSGLAVDQAVRVMSEHTINTELPTHIASLRGTFMRQEEFDELYMFLPPPQVENKKRKCMQKFFHPCLSPDQFFRFIVSFIPIIGWLPEYKWKRNLLGDFLAGITVGIMHVPQGIAYAILQGVDPVYGLYSSFFPALFYMIFGTSQHVSIGMLSYSLLLFEVLPMHTYKTQGKYC
ncbi:unnamed protein product [Toxocara canis]|uniref:Sulfate_transp domain-containing protein n=1 Tax=Toxocara canis TaxID=6265 RepID=A0A183UGX4_TOXCA|nr:unnamed protein product [Toxocara canis]